MDLGDWRSRINDIDSQILHLLNQRAEAALRIGDLKRRQASPSYVPEREAEVLTRLTDASRGPLPAAAVTAGWREILSACRALEAPLVVAYLAPPATFTHQAARERFGEAAEYLASRTIAEIFEDVERGRAQFGVVPVENSTDGAVNVTLGLPFVRTSPDHGTAYDIAGTGRANPESFLAALDLATRIAG